MAEQPDFIRSLPPWAGTTFVSKLNHEIPTSLDPAKQSLPSPFVVVVTGSSRGIGRATAKSFAQAGATGLILTARTVEALQETKDSCKAVAKSSDLKITTLAADNAVESSALAVADAIKTEHNGRLDLLVNNAGILNVDETAFGNIIDMDPSNIEQTISVNYVGRFYMIKYLLPLLLNGGSTTKAIVNISSVVSQISGPLGFSISALATNRLSQRVAEAYADQGVVCYAVHPGAVKPEVPPPGMPPHFEEMAKESVGLCGSFLVWLVKEKREWLSGRYLDATWDVEELEKKREEIVEGDKLKMRLVV
ncbi:hypothetical protein LTR91_010580 [Friedmanniomyces endolithicus]|uniref:NAD(P)-binding protein n=1 Tax=Friedmanniomyces endolithicus TaxID=329885 RepID=A0AAN6F7M9_9PEZI|nr:hypothetical protein LTR35_017239 [Friedmanniomyces endolithicus]KAK0270766.1 hypothetical protein LTS00_016826 [Friedmanniomyces endolithicus]KAK0301714.1 hypothetical protein LTR01_009201 [Friedmanniomyces endolithicus]KAK0305051.1 hypothetical protein LTR82_016956 [Friedmanniomyces endolithicus]KAK0822572.1 hypothetical protein LTR73_009210 [Friedmanniomyces endolithicus]